MVDEFMYRRAIWTRRTEAALALYFFLLFPFSMPCLELADLVCGQVAGLLEAYARLTVRLSTRDETNRNCY